MKSGHEAPWMECVPNFSEGRNGEIIEAIRSAVQTTPRVHLLNQHRDSFHNRTVLTFVGEKKDVVEAAFRAITCAAELIDLTLHSGEHPRMGATDVVPFVPIGGETPEACIVAASELGKRVGEELNIPVILYGLAATTEKARSLPKIRRKGFEQFQEEGSIGTEPDFGPDNPHPTAGVTAVGARNVLVAYNIFLATGDVAIAKRIAETVRTSSGGLPGVHAKGFAVEGRAQVSMNLLDVTATTLQDVFDKVGIEAKKLNTDVYESELVGLAPQAVLDSKIADEIKLRTDWTDHVLELKLDEARERAG